MKPAMIARRSVCMAILTLGSTFLVFSCGRLTRDEAEARIRTALDRTVQGHPDWAGASLLIHSDTRGIHTLIKAAPRGPDAYHIASIGKTFTATLIGRLIDSGRLHLEDAVRPILEPGLLDGLFVVNGQDCQALVTVDHLMSHMSGVADYFAGEARGGKSISTLITEDPGHFWTPAELLDFTRTQQVAVGRPGETYHYSDTGYILLGLLVEKLHGMPFEAVLDREILTPLGMGRTWMPLRSHPMTGEVVPIRAAWLAGTDVSRFASITADWAGGGIASTEEDLLKFQKALWSGRLISEKMLVSMKSFDNTFQKGIHYGKGLMQLRFGEFFFLLGAYPRMVGHMGVLATHMFYDPVTDIHLVVSFGSDAAMEDSVKFMIEVLGILLRLG